MHYIIEEILINLPQLMICYMCEAANKTHASLPYGVVLALIFREFGVPITDEESKRLMRHTNHYNLQTLHHMGYKKENGQWVKKGREPRQAKGTNRIILEAPPARPISPS